MELLTFKINPLKTSLEESLSQTFHTITQISTWNVQEDMLWVSGQQIDPQQIINCLKQLNINAELVRVQGLAGGDV